MSSLLVTAGVVVDVDVWTAQGVLEPPEERDVSIDCQPGQGSGSTQLSWAFPAHGEHDSFGIKVQGSGFPGMDVIPASSADWTYTYRWQP